MKIVVDCPSTRYYSPHNKSRKYENIRLLKSKTRTVWVKIQKTNLMIVRIVCDYMDYSNDCVHCALYPNSNGYEHYYYITRLHFITFE